MHPRIHPGRVGSLLAVGLWLAAAGCESQAQKPPAAPSPAGSVVPSSGEKAMTIKVTSTAFHEGQRIPVQYTGEGKDLSPPLTWTNVPEGTKELALLCDDPDAPRPEPWVHWVLYKLPPETKALPEGIPAKNKLEKPVSALQGKNSWPSGQTIGYRGPLPPKGHGQHRYFFRLYALDTTLSLEPGASKEQLLKAMEGHVLAEGQLMGTYSRE